MRFRKSGSPQAELDWTPMIDMAFQLITFFMFTISFNEAEQAEGITLPRSELARPPDAPFEYPIFVQLTKRGTVLLGGEESPLSGLKSLMIREGEFLKLNRKSPGDATVIIRADASTVMGKVQEVIKICQESKFEVFAPARNKKSTE